MDIYVNTINNYFVKIPIDLSGAQNYIVKLNSVPLKRPCCRFSFRPMSEADALSAILRMSSNAAGADKTPIKFNKLILPVVLPFTRVVFKVRILF